MNGFATLWIISQKKMVAEPIAAIPNDSALYTMLHCSNEKPLASPAGTINMARLPWSSRAERRKMYR